MIALLPGIMAGIVGLAIGCGLGFWRSALLAAITGAILISVPWGIWIAEFPIGLLLGGVCGSSDSSVRKTTSVR